LFPRASVDELRNFVLNNLVQCDDGRWTYRYEARLRGPNAARRQPDDAISWALLSQVTCPTLIIRSAEGESSNTRAITEQMQRTLPNARLVELPNSGHAVPWENPNGLSVLVRASLAEPSTT
jgi:pimeloyl-ACP methyl ester carboxylesterase